MVLSGPCGRREGTYLLERQRIGYVPLSQASRSFLPFPLQSGLKTAAPSFSRLPLARDKSGGVFLESPGIAFLVVLSTSPLFPAYKKIFFLSGRAAGAAFLERRSSSLDNMLVTFFWDARWRASLPFLGGMGAHLSWAKQGHRSRSREKRVVVASAFFAVGLRRIPF